jgi:CheY-like chemotaxis protein
MKRSLVLIAEDHQDTMELLSLILSQEGFEVEKAADGGQALEALEHARPDVLLVDLMMPVIDGVELIRRVRERPELADVPIVATSAFSGPHLESAARSGATVVMRKPFEPRVIADVVRLALGKDDIPLV